METNHRYVTERAEGQAERRAQETGTGWGVAALLGAMFLGNVDVAVANIAGPSIRAGLHASGDELTMIVPGYTLVYAVLLVNCARLGAGRGYRRMFFAGLIGFILASLACGLAPDALVLIAARVAAGAAATSYATIAVTRFAGDTGGALLVCLLTVAGLGLGTGFAGMLRHLVSAVGPDQAQAADISGMYNTVTRVGGVIGTAAFGTAYLALARNPVHGFAMLNLALAATALAAAMAGLSVRRCTVLLGRSSSSVGVLK
jgi:MFS family permease